MPYSLLGTPPLAQPLLLESNVKGHTNPCLIYLDALALRGQAILYLQREVIHKFTYCSMSQ